MSTTFMVVREVPDVICPRCGTAMAKIQPCHEKCMNCGAEIDCSDGLG
tara:strand:+ start:7820 stop:7963 length:144 start_codon:yes stop_codon:yes gene_type:complete